MTGKQTHTPYSSLSLSTILSILHLSQPLSLSPNNCLFGPIHRLQGIAFNIIDLDLSFSISFSLPLSHSPRTSWLEPDWHIINHPTPMWPNHNSGHSPGCWITVVRYKWRCEEESPCSFSSPTPITSIPQWWQLSYMIDSIRFCNSDLLIICRAGSTMPKSQQEVHLGW